MMFLQLSGTKTNLFVWNVLPRRGLPCHTALVDALLSGLDVADGEKIIFLDILPNRPAHEFFLVLKHSFHSHCVACCMLVFRNY